MRSNKSSHYAFILCHTTHKTCFFLSLFSLFHPFFLLFLFFFLFTYFYSFSYFPLFLFLVLFSFSESGMLSQYNDCGTVWTTEVRSTARAGGRFFFSSPPIPDPLWDPPSLLSNEYQGVFPQG